MSAQKHIVVVGAGIVGASIAWRLVRGGSRVTVVAGSGRGGVATPCSFGWVNANWGNPKPYFDLRTRSMAEWTVLKAEVPAIPFARRGALCWNLPPAELEAFAVQHASWGYGIRRVGRAEIARMEPNLADPPDWALHVAEEGAAEPAGAAHALLEAARRQGATIRTGLPVSALVRAGDRIVGVDTAEGVIEADEIVVAAGTGSPALLAGIGVSLPMDTPPGLLVHSRPHRRLLEGIIIADNANIRQTPEGRIVGGSDFAGAPPGDDPNETARILFGTVKAMLAGAEELELEFHTVGYRPLPRDEFPVVGRPAGRHGLYVATTHSGVTLAPALGLFAAEEILSGRREPLLAPYGPDRFA